MNKQPPVPTIETDITDKSLNILYSAEVQTSFSSTATDSTTLDFWSHLIHEQLFVRNEAKIPCFLFFMSITIIHSANISHFFHHDANEPGISSQTHQADIYLISQHIIDSFICFLPTIPLSLWRNSLDFHHGERECRQKGKGASSSKNSSREPQRSSYSWAEVHQSISYLHAPALSPSQVEWKPQLTRERPVTFRSRSSFASNS